MRIPVSHKYPLGIEPRSLMMGSKQVDYWTSGTVYESSEITGSPLIHGGGGATKNSNELELVRLFF